VGKIIEKVTGKVFNLAACYNLSAAADEKFLL